MAEYSENKGNAMRVRESALPVGAIQGTFACSALTGLLLIVCSAIAWDSDYIGSECAWLNSGQEHINYDGCKRDSVGGAGGSGCLNPLAANVIIPSCPTEVTAADGAKERFFYTCAMSCHTSPPGKVSNMKECLTQLCSKNDEIYFGQCDAPDLAITGGVLAIITVGLGFGAIFISGSVGGCNSSTVLCIITAFMGFAALCISTASFVTSFFRWGEWKTNVDGNEWEILVQTGSTSNAGSTDCSYNYSDAPTSYKAMTAFAFLTAISNIAVIVLTSMVTYQRNLYDQQLGTDAKNTDRDIQQEFL